MSEWRKVTIGELVTLRQGFAINAKSKYYISKEQTSLALLRIADMKSGSKEIFVKEDIPQNFIAKPQDIIYTRTGNVGLVFRNNYGVVHNNCFTVTPNDEWILSRDFLYYLLQSQYFFEKANSLARGAAQPDLPHSLFNSIEISYPSLQVQNKIATILSRYDSLIENYQKQIKLLEESAQRLYKEWFIDLRFPGHENTKIVDGVPEGWEKKKLTDIAELKAGGDKPGIVSDVRTEDCAIPIFSNGTTNEGLYGFTKVPEIMEHCVTISARGSVGYTVLRRTPFVPIVRLISVIPHNIYVGYIFFYLKSTTLDSNGAAQQQITIPMIRNKEITIPSKGILEIFESQTEPIFNQIDILKSQIHHLTEARDRLHPKLMSGEIEV